jgi:transcription-repair coupling factor (superfamily II helicase)
MLLIPQKVISNLMRFADWAVGLAKHTPLGLPSAPLQGTLEWRSITPEARPVLVAASYLADPVRTVIITASHERALAWQAKLELAGINRANIWQLPSGNSGLFDDSAPESVALSDRLGALHALVSDEPSIIITTPGAVLERTLPREELESAFLTLKVGDSIDPDELTKLLHGLGYEPAEPVRVPGQFSRRGGIFDVFASGRDMPARIELFGDEVESLRSFDPGSQRSSGTIPFLAIAPSRETLYTHLDPTLAELIEATAEREAADLPEEAGQRLIETVRGDAQALSSRTFFDRLDLYRPLLHPDSGCALDLLDEESFVILDEPIELDLVAQRSEEDLSDGLNARIARGEMLRAPVNDYMFSADHLGRNEKILALTGIEGLPDWLSVPQSVEVGAVSLESYRGRPEALTQTLVNYKAEGFAVYFATDQPNRARSMLNGIDIFPTEAAEASFEPGFYLLSGNPGGGFVIPAAKFAVVSDAELFGVARLKLPQKKFKDSAPIATVLDLKPGDHVVHINFGIGVFRGLIQREEHGVQKEFLYIEYQAPDKLFVPTDQLDRIQKYLNPADTVPKLNKLTGGEWQKTLGKAREDAKEFARDLVKLYAKRKEVQRRPFPSDTPFQAEMEGTFPWVETPSQLQAIRDAKKDLEQPYPMDRLVCGDVGFGKTEVAIRVAFKAVQDNRQVAVLCPTTILSEQHFRNFQERLGPFSVRLALLNRYTHADERKRIFSQVKDGKIDILIGTHSLLGQGLEFNHLGLAIIDEEQKFGVKQKEMLKHLRTEIDVLTLSATPIPRTLSMALMDIRQMSLINDPPPGRLPIRTYVRPYSTEVVRESILRELSRGGQVYYVYNRVESIEHVAEKLRKIVPHARIGVGHGQMTEKELEPIMVGFIKGEIDILLSTTIVENGLDIANSNTLIVENADKLGLSQLYQLRGRVGRSDRQAYAYLLFNSGKELTENARARLQALQEFSTLGSGYSLAFRDLQIRGAGELLGAKQSGSMANVGYELYWQLINEAVAMLKIAVDAEGESADGEVRDPLEALEPLPALDLPVEAFLPESFIPDQSQRLYFYQRLMSARDEATVGQVQGEIEDRYGRLPEPARLACEIVALRIQMKKLGVSKIDGNGGRLAIQFKQRDRVPVRAWSILTQRVREAYLSRETLVWPFTGSSVAATSRALSAFAQAVAQVEEERASFSR